MPKHVKLRKLTEEEVQAVQRLARSRTASIRIVQRAKIIVALLDKPTLTASDAALRAGYRSAQSGPLWFKRFNAAGLAWRVVPDQAFSQRIARKSTAS